MKILVLTFYYSPDLSAGSFRTSALVNQLAARLPPDSTIEVLTTMPNRYGSHEVSALRFETTSMITIRRFELPAHRSGMLDQARAFLAFDRAVVGHTRDERYDLVFATSSRLMTAFLGARVARRCGAPLYLDIRDIFTDTIADVIGGTKAKLLLPILRHMERYAIKSADRVNLVSAGFGPYFEERYPAKHFDLFTNGIDEEFLGQEWKAEPVRERHPLRVLYAGNIGEGQGLHRILPQLAALAGDDYIFVIVGDGGRRQQLVRSLSERGVANVRIEPPVRRSELIRLYREADILFLHLNDYDAFDKVLPSKIFEYAATGKPILAGVREFSARFLQREVENCGIFPPCDAHAAWAVLRRMSRGGKERTAFIRRYSRSEIMSRMAQSLLETRRQPVSEALAP